MVADITGIESSDDNNSKDDDDDNDDDDHIDNEDKQNINQTNIENFWFLIGRLRIARFFISMLFLSKRARTFRMLSKWKRL